MAAGKEQRMDWLNSSLIEFTEGLASPAPVPGGGSHLVLTRFEGMYHYDGRSFRRFPTQADGLLQSMDPTCAALTPQGDGICVGTRKGGLIVLSADGQLRFRLQSANILDTDVIHALHGAPDGFLWAATGDGIFRVNPDSPLRVLRNLPSRTGGVNCASYQEPHLYLGTDKGLFLGQLDAPKGSLSALQEVTLPAKGEVLSLSVFDSQLFCGTNGSSFEITPGGPQDVCYLPGGACMDQGRIYDREVLVQGTYSNLAVFVREKGRWVFSHGVKDYLGPVRYLKVDASGTIWAAPYYGGVYALQLTEDLKNIARKDFFESLCPGKSLPVRVTRFASRILFTDGESGWYTFNEFEKKMVPYPPLHGVPALKALLPLSPLRTIFLFQDHACLMRTASADSLTLQGRVPFLSAGTGTTHAYSAFLPVNDSCYFFATDDRLALWDWKKAESRPGEVPALSLSRVTAHDYQHGRDTLLPLQGGERPRLAYPYRNLNFQLRCHADELLSRHSYRYRIGGLDTTWRQLGRRGEIALNYLPHGRYELQLELVSPYSGVLSSLSYPFTIRPPFRHSPLAYLLYTLLGLTVLASAATALWYRERARRQQKEALFRAAIEKEKTERIASERDLLRHSLSSSTFNLIHRNEALTRIKDTLTEQKLRLGKDYPDKDYRRMCALIDAEIKTEAEWTQFEQLFDKAHNHFFRTLRSRYPQLTDNDLRLCAYLRMNIPNKEIASLMNISDKSLETARGRIRKKMGLATEESLNAHIMQI